MLTYEYSSQYHAREVGYVELAEYHRGKEYDAEDKEESKSLKEKRNPRKEWSESIA